MEYIVVILLSFLASGAAIGDNRAIKVENIQDVCAAMNNVSQFIKAGLPGSECVYTVNGSNICENCLDLNCSLAIMVSGLPLTIVSEFSLLPCHDGNLDVPIHVIGSRIFTVTGQELFGRQSNQSFEDSFELTVLSATVTVLVSAMIENRGNGVFFRANVSAAGPQLEVFPPTFIPINCTKVDSSECFDGTSGATPVAVAVWSIILLVMLSLSSLA